MDMIELKKYEVDYKRKRKERIEDKKRQRLANRSITLAAPNLVKISVK